MEKMTDTEMIDFLEKLNQKGDYTGVCVLRMSNTSRGWRLHETMDRENAHPTVREAIQAFAEEEKNDVTKIGSE